MVSSRGERPVSDGALLLPEEKRGGVRPMRDPSLPSTRSRLIAPGPSRPQTARLRRQERGVEEWQASEEEPDQQPPVVAPEAREDRDDHNPEHIDGPEDEPDARRHGNVESEAMYPPLAAQFASRHRVPAGAPPRRSRRRGHPGIRRVPHTRCRSGRRSWMALRPRCPRRREWRPSDQPRICEGPRPHTASDTRAPARGCASTRRAASASLAPPRCRAPSAPGPVAARRR